MEPKQSSPSSLGIEASVMAIREVVMEYFKGTCAERVTAGGRVSTYNLRINMRGRPNYERVSLQNRDITLLVMGGAPILVLERCPDTVYFHTGVFDRSKELRKVRTLLKDFFKQYMPGIVLKASRNLEVKDASGTVLYHFEEFDSTEQHSKRSDKALVARFKVKLPNRPPVPLDDAVIAAAMEEWDEVSNGTTMVAPGVWDGLASDLVRPIFRPRRSGTTLTDMMQTVAYGEYNYDFEGGGIVRVSRDALSTNATEVAQRMPEPSLIELDDIPF